MQLKRGAAVIAAGCLGAVACGGSSDTTVALDTTDGGDASVISPPADAQGTVDATTNNDASVTDATLPTDAPSGLLCIPGASVACVGAGGCASNQICDIDGTGFFPCVCPGDGGSQVCAPGQSVACVGPGGCVTNQVCRNDGTGFGSCVCGSDGGVAQLCVPGEAIGCVGFGGCVSNQVCKTDGSGYDACTCASDGGKTLACVPGQSIACGGPNGCSSFQVCKNDGSGYAECECPDAGAIDASVGWTPAQLPGLALWLDDTYGLVPDPAHPGYVVRWRDRSGHGNDATMSSNSYLLDPQSLNGHDALFCNVGDLGMHINQADSLDFGTADFGLILVKLGMRGQIANAGNPYGWIWEQGNLTITWTFQQSLALTLNAQTISETVPVVTGFDIVVARGRQPASISDENLTASGQLTGAFQNGSIRICDSAPGELAEVVAINGTLSDADLAKTVSYLKTKFAL